MPTALFNFSDDSVQLFAAKVFNSSDVCNEAAQSRIVVSAAQIVQPGFLIIDIATILEGVQLAERVGQRTSRVNDLSPSIVRIGYYLGTSIVKQANDIILLVIKVSIGRVSFGMLAIIAAEESAAARRLRRPPVTALRMRVII